MKRFIWILLCCLLLTACGQDAAAPTAAPTEPLPSETAAPTETETAPPTEAPTEVPTDPAPVIFTVYRSNDNADGFIAAYAEVPEITAEAVTDILIESGTLPSGVIVNSLKESDGCLYLDFNAPFRDLIFTQGTAGERMVMGSVVNTFLSAYCADSVQITVDGEILESGHVIYDFPLTFME